MKRDAEVLMAVRARAKGKTQEQAAAKSGMSVRTLRKYEQTAQLPSQLTGPRTYRTRQNPFTADWSWVVTQLERDPALQATTLFRLLSEQHPDRYTPAQLRTLQKHIAVWRAQYGPEREVIFPQVHRPAEMAQSDFTAMNDLGLTIAGSAFPHLLFHLVLVYSNVEAVQLCRSESFEALAEGIEHGLWRLGGVPERHRTDHLSAAIKPLDRPSRAEWTQRYLALMNHYGMVPDTNNVGVAHENGDVEQSHHRFKVAVDQAVRVRGSRDFDTQQASVRFLDEVVTQRNRTRKTRLLEEHPYLKPLPATPLRPAQELRVRVSRFSTIRVLSNTYSVPSRLIGSRLTVRVRADQVEVYQGTVKRDTLPRLVGTGGCAIDDRHLSWSLVRKPGAFAHYRYRDELFPSLVFRRVYDRLSDALPARADREYVRLLHLAASTSEAEVEAAMHLVLEAGNLPTFDPVRDLVRHPAPVVAPQLSPPVLDLAVYDRLIGGGQ